MAPATRSNGLLAALVSITAGAALWIWAAAAGHKVEAWDGPYYFSRVVPALWVVAAICGLLAPRMPWRWPVLMYATQFVIMVTRTKGAVGPLAPLGLIMMAVLAAITMVPAYLGSFVRRRYSRSGHHRRTT